MENLNVTLEIRLSTGTWIYLGGWMCNSRQEADETVQEYAQQYVDDNPDYNYMETIDTTTTVYDRDKNGMARFCIKPAV